MKIISLLIMAIMMLMLAGCSGSKGTEAQKPTVDSVNVIADEEDKECVIEGTHIENMNCGYISNNIRPEPYVLYLITDEADLEAAETKLGIAIHEDPDGDGQYYTTHIDVLRNIMSNYPLASYDYLFVYLEYGSLGHSSHADKVVYKDEALYFHYDAMESPDENQAVCDAMDGEFKIAAIPKEAIKDKKFTYNVRPSEIEDTDESTAQ